MNIKYSSYDKNKLLHIMDSGKHLGDIDCFLDVAHKIQAELSRLQSRVDGCKIQLEQQKCPLERNIDEAQGRINEAQQAIKNTPTTETVYPNKDSLQKGEAPITRSINGDIIAKYKDTIAYQQKEIESYNRRLHLLKQDEQALRDGEAKISQYLSVVSEAIRWLEYARKNAESNCKEIRQAINNAAICMENYIKVRGSYGSFEAVRHIEPKKGW